MQVAEYNYVSIEQGTASDIFVASHSLLGERKELPASKFIWCLHFDTAGLAYFVSGEQRLWSSQLFNKSVLNIEGELFVVKGPEDVVELQQHRASHGEESIQIDVPLGTARLRCFRMRTSWGGAYFFWCIKTLFGLVHLDTKMKPDQWKRAWWEWWGKDIAKHGFDAKLHCRLPMETAIASSASAKVVEPIEGINHRVLPVASWSTYGLLLLLCRLGAPSASKLARSKRGPAAQDHKWRLLLAMILAYSIVAPLTFTLFLGGSSVCKPGLTCVGSCPVDVVCQGGSIDVTPLRASTRGSALLRQLEVDGAGSAPLANFMVDLYCQGKPAQDVFKQMICNVGLAIETYVSGALLDRSVAAANVLRPRAGITAVCSFGQSQRDRFKYYMCSRRSFRTWQYLSIAVDATRLMKRSIFLGWASLPSGLGCWLCPQVLGEKTDKHT
jgi:hypothetical protein